MDDPSFDPFERTEQLKEITLKDKIASRPLNESQLYHIPSDVKRYLRNYMDTHFKGSHFKG